MNGKAWTETERGFLKRFYSETRTLCLANILGRTESQVYNQAYALNIEKSQEYLQKKGGRLTKGDTRGDMHRYSKGHKPWNTGIKGRIKPNSGSFQKGSLPHNTREEGAKTKRSDGYWWVRIGLADWKQLHRHIWEQANGAIPKGMLLVFKDRNPDNCTLENLELITRKENVLRNSIHNWPPELQKLKRQLGTLTRKINEKEKAKH